MMDTDPILLPNGVVLNYGGIAPDGAMIINVKPPLPAKCITLDFIATLKTTEEMAEEGIT